MAKKSSKTHAEEAAALAPTPAEVVSLPSSEFVKVEKNLTSLGFFSPSSKNTKNPKAKTININYASEGKRVVGKVSIEPAASYGLPTTADQDNYFAIQKIVDELRQRGEVKNPISFTSAELIRAKGRVKAGKNYDDLERSLKRIALTGIVSEAAVYFAGTKTRATDIFHVFQRVVLFGKKLPDGTTADKNYVWLSEWQLENINSNFLLPIDFETYKNLKNHIAKALVPLLQIWLFASREEAYFEKRYDELCEYLNIRCYPQVSRIREQLSPALDELKAHGYLKNWKIEEAQQGYKIIFYHGEKFYRDQLTRTEQKTKTFTPKLVKNPIQLALPEPSRTPAPETISAPSVLLAASEERSPLVVELVSKFGVDELKARELVSAKPEEVKKQLGAFSLRKVAITSNLAGWIIRAIEHGYFVPPAYFESQRKAEGRQEAARQVTQTEICPLCDSNGFRSVGRGVTKCHHDAGKNAAFDEKLRREGKL
jgi:hypothetical protein